LVGFLSGLVSRVPLVWSGRAGQRHLNQKQEQIMPFHFQPKDRKKDLAEDITEYVRSVNQNPQVQLPTLLRCSLHDLSALILALTAKPK
jgi:hypothetical protein